MRMLRILPILCACSVMQMAEADTTAIANAPVQVEVSLTCTFTTECFDFDACTETALTVDLSGLGGGLEPDELILAADITTDAETFAMLGTQNADQISLTGESDYGHGLFTLSAGAARWTVHYADGPMSITYGGTCA